MPGDVTSGRLSQAARVRVNTHRKMIEIIAFFTGFRSPFPVLEAHAIYMLEE
jgi:hypothetical protein